MKKLMLFIALFWAHLAFGQGVVVPPQTAFETVNGVTRPIPGASITVCAALTGGIPCSPALTNTLFQDVAMTQPLTNPFFADANGNYTFVVPAGTYTVTVSALGFGGYSYQIQANVGGGGGGGSGTVGPGTVNVIAKFTGLTAVGNSSATDDGVNPTRTPNGENTATGGLEVERPAAANVSVGQLVCRSNVNQVVPCPAGTTQGVLGVSKSTVTTGQTVIICALGTCFPLMATNATAGHWLIPSASVAGEADDTLSATEPTNGTQHFLAESSVTSGNAVQTAFLSLDTANSNNGNGSGTVTPCTQFGLTYYSAAGTSNVLNCIIPPTLNGATFFPIYKPNGSAVAPIVSQAGLPGRKFTSGTTDAIVCGDRAPGTVQYQQGSAATVTVPDPSSTCFGTNPAFAVAVENASTTFTRQSAATFTVDNGISSFVTNSFGMTAGQFATFSSPDNANWLVRINANISFLGIPSPFVRYLGGASYTILNSDNGWRVVAGFTNSILTLPAPSTLSGGAPFVATRANTVLGSCTACTTGSFTQNAGDLITVEIVLTNAGVTTINSVTDSAGDFFVRIAPDQINSGGGSSYSTSFWQAQNVASSGSNTVTVNLSGAAAPYIGVDEYSVITFDRGSSAKTATTTPPAILLPTDYSNEVVLAASGGSTNNCPNGWTLRHLFSGSAGALCEQLVSNASAVNFVPQSNGGSGSAIAIGDWQITSAVGFVAGWETTVENSTGSGSTLSAITVNAVGSTTINGTQHSLVIAPNEWCKFMSDGALNYETICGFMPNRQQTNLMGGAVEIGYASSSNLSADLGSTALVSSVPTDTLLTVSAAVVCRTSVAGTETVTIAYTDTNSVAQTLTATTGTCNGGSPATGQISASIRAKGSSTVNVSTSHTGSQPNFDVSAVISELTIN